MVRLPAWPRSYTQQGQHTCLTALLLISYLCCTGQTGTPQKGQRTQASRGRGLNTAADGCTPSKPPLSRPGKACTEEVFVRLRFFCAYITNAHSHHKTGFTHNLSHMQLYNQGLVHAPLRRCWARASLSGVASCPCLPAMTYCCSSLVSTNCITVPPACSMTVLRMMNLQIPWAAACRNSVLHRQTLIQNTCLMW